MLKVDATKLLQELEKFHKDNTRKLENVVKGFAYIISKTAIANTPLGDSEQYFKLYQQRQRRLGLQPVEGFARGSWSVNTSGQFSIQEIYTVNSGSAALSLIKSDLGGYRLGQDVYIGNKGYYIKFLENGYSQQAPMGIMQPTLETVLSTYRVDIKQLYDQG